MSVFYEKTWCRLHYNYPKVANKTKDVFHLTTQIHIYLYWSWSYQWRGKNSVYFPNPSHEAFRVPRCRRQFNVCCSPRPMSKVIYGLMMLVGLDLFIRGGPGLLSPPNWVTEAKGVDGLSEQWPEGGNSTVCNRVTYVGKKRKREKRKKKEQKMLMYEWSCDGLNSFSVALNSTLNRSRMFSLVFFLPKEHELWYKVKVWVLLIYS